MPVYEYLCNISQELVIYNKEWIDKLIIWNFKRSKELNKFCDDMDQRILNANIRVPV